ncbi:MAG: hypothetical protein ACKPKO_64960, partial [Candidatus Fonsibacter sp.]
MYTKQLRAYLFTISLFFYLQTETISGVGNSWIELCGSLPTGSTLNTFIDFTTFNTDSRARFGYALTANQWNWSAWTGSSSSVNMTLQSSGSYVGGTLVSASDKRLKFN